MADTAPASASGGGGGSAVGGPLAWDLTPPATPAALRSIFDISARNGYLPAVRPLRKLPDAFAALEHVMASLPTLLGSADPDALKTAVASLPSYEVAADASPVLLQSLMRDYSILVSAYLLEGKNKAGVPRSSVPANIAVPFAAVAQRVDEQWIMSYDSYCLTNCYSLKDDADAATAGGFVAYSSEVDTWDWDALRLVRAFDGGPEECTFVTVHFEIESNTPALVAAYADVFGALDAASLPGVVAALARLKGVLERIIVAQLKMFNASDPANYEKYVRPWIFGWRGNPDFKTGVTFEGTGMVGTQLRGETGAQSSIVPSMDIMMGITHRADALRVMLAELEAYRPAPQRAFLSALRTAMWGTDAGAGLARAAPDASGGAGTSGAPVVVPETADDMEVPHRLRDFVRASRDPAAVRAFNECIAAVWAFRDIHVTFSALYIGRYTDRETATGGTPYKAYLRKHRDESMSHQLTELGDECRVRPAVPTQAQFAADLDAVADPSTPNGIPAHLLARHADIIARHGRGSPALSRKSFPSRAAWTGL